MNRKFDPEQNCIQFGDPFDEMIKFEKAYRQIAIQFGGTLHNPNKCFGFEKSQLVQEEVFTGQKVLDIDSE